jgi:hypothetical protein
MVLACGVRKVWAKEFQDHPKPSQQIKRLKEILTDLGMTGRFTLQQAKMIKEKREMAQELGVLEMAFRGWVVLTIFFFFVSQKMFGPSTR